MQPCCPFGWCWSDRNLHSREWWRKASRLWLTLGRSMTEWRTLWGTWWSIGRPRGPGIHRHYRCRGAGRCIYAPCWEEFGLFWSSLDLRESPWRMIPRKVAYLVLLHWQSWLILLGSNFLVRRWISFLCRRQEKTCSGLSDQGPVSQRRSSLCSSNLETSKQNI